VLSACTKVALCGGPARDGLGLDDRSILAGHKFAVLARRRGQTALLRVPGALAGASFHDDGGRSAARLVGSLSEPSQGGGRIAQEACGSRITVSLRFWPLSVAHFFIWNSSQVGQPLPQLAIDWEDSSADAHFFLERTPAGYCWRIPKSPLSTVRRLTAASREQMPSASFFLGQLRQASPTLVRD
jgi:hypothetical protein